MRLSATSCSLPSDVLVVTFGLGAHGVCASKARARSKRATNQTKNRVETSASCRFATALARIELMHSLCLPLPRFLGNALVGLLWPNCLATPPPSEVGRRSLQKLRHSDLPRTACYLATTKSYVERCNTFRLIAHRCLLYFVGDDLIHSSATVIRHFLSPDEFRQGNSRRVSYAQAC